MCVCVCVCVNVLLSTRIHVMPNCEKGYIIILSHSVCSVWDVSTGVQCLTRAVY